jgi:hypothetical protein
MFAKLVALVFPLGLDTFAVAAALGALGVSGRRRLRISLAGVALAVLALVLLAEKLITRHRRCYARVMSRALYPARLVEPIMSVTAFTPSPRRRCQQLLATLVAAVCAIAIAGCGSSGHRPNASSRGGSFLAFSECMRGHGVSGFPDPGPHGGIQISSSSGINPASPAFQAAQLTCKKLLPGGGPPAHASEQQKQQLFAMSECMRSHGVSGFPDPVTSTTPPSDPQNYSIAEGTGDLWLLVPNTINPSSPAFTKAAKACKFR